MWAEMDEITSLAQDKLEPVRDDIKVFSLWFLVNNLFLFWNGYTLYLPFTNNYEL
jgi:hypothetical protein